MKRITVDEVKAAYLKTGLKPIQNMYVLFDSRGQCGCALTACAIASGEATFQSIFDSVVRSSTVVRALGIDALYHDGFANGFDGFRVEQDCSERMKEGYADGKAAAEAVFS